jgi:CheY-like chemotaxis protein
MLRTLIVDDNATFRQSLREMLDEEFSSMEFLEASNSLTGVRPIICQPPGLSDG